MKTYKPTYRDRSGKTRKCARWHLTFVDNRQIRRRLPAYGDKAATDRLGIQLQKLLDANGVLDADLQKWFTGLIPAVRDKLIEFGLIDSRRMMKHIDKTLSEHAGDYEQFLLAKNDTPRHAGRVRDELENIFSGCQFRFFADIDANAVANYLKYRRDNDRRFGQRTSNDYLGAVKRFCRWAIKTQRTTPPNPLECLDTIRQTEFKHKRRAIEIDEVRRVLQATKDGPERYGMTGAERYLLYRVATETGLRANELRSLTVSSFDLTAKTVTVQAAYSKRKRLDVLPIRPDTAEELRDFFKGKLPTVKAFGGTYAQLTDKTAKMLKADLAEAGIEYCVNGLYFDFHSQRHETGTLLAASHVSPKTAQTLMRHSDINLTMNIYTHTLRGDEAEAVATLPDLTTKTGHNVLSVA